MKTDHDLPQPFAVGRTAELYPWDENLVLKLFRPAWDEAAVRYEAEKTRIVHAAGLKAPYVEGVVELDSRYGILLERISGVSLTKVIAGKPWALIQLARSLADLHQEIHACSLPDLPSQKDRLIRRLQGIKGMPEDVRQKLLDTLNSLPQQTAVCHGDFHPENIMITERGPVILDWMDATSGSPLSDVARTALLMENAILPPDLPGRRIIELIRRLFMKIYLRHYFSKNSFLSTDWAAWQAVLAAARLSEDIPEEQETLINIVRSWYESSSS
jgi:uncharacterized protein (TIGR02172 family)